MTVAPSAHTVSIKRHAADGESEAKISLKLFWLRQFKYSEFCHCCCCFKATSWFTCCFQCLHWPRREETGGKLEWERKQDYLSTNQTFISSLNDCMFIALPEAQYKVFWTSDELIKLNPVTFLLFGSVTSLPAPCLICVSYFALYPTVKQFFLRNLASSSYLSSLSLSNARTSCLKILFRPLLVYEVVQIPRWVCSCFTSDTIGLCWALGFKRR